MNTKINSVPNIKPLEDISITHFSADSGQSGTGALTYKTTEKLKREDNAKPQGVRWEAPVFL